VSRRCDREGVRWRREGVPARLARGWTALPWDPLAHRARWGVVVDRLAPTMDQRTEPVPVVIGAGWVARHLREPAALPSPAEAAPAAAERGR